MGSESLRHRLGVKTTSGKLVYNDFPTNARIALDYMLDGMNQKGYITGLGDLELELKRIGRFITNDFERVKGTATIFRPFDLLYELEWHQVFEFCERIYARFLKDVELYDRWIYLDEVRQFFSEEINLILDEENLAYHFENGVFVRRGRAQTQKTLERVGTVLSDPKLDKVRKLFNKARGEFDRRPEPDTENCVKDAICALEVCLQILTGKPAGKDFPATIRQSAGNGSRQIPSPIIESMVKLHSYRGSGVNVSHGTLDGNKVTELEAELVLSMVATFITYLVDLMPAEDEIPF
jgi:hypothetical protein